ncbi:MAG: rhomboid family intramembrane serine protease [Chloroflexota bacterium]
MFPIKDINPRHRTPYVTFGLLILNIVAFIYQFNELYVQEMWVPFINMWALIPVQLVNNPALEAFTIITSMFLHGGLLHIGGNMLYLWIFGDNIEDVMGHGRFLTFYLLCGIVAALTHVVTDPASNIPTIGASGAVAGVLGGYFVLFPMASVRTVVPILLFRTFHLPAWVLLGFWFLMQLLNGYLALNAAQESGIAFWAHIGGFVAGVLLVKVFGDTRELSQRQIEFLQQKQM